MAPRKENIRQRIILPFFGLMLTVFLLGVYSSYRLQQYHLNAEVDSKLAEVNNLFNHLLALEAKSLQSMINFLDSDERLIESWKRRDREALYRISQPIYDKIRRGFGVTHFYFIDPRKECFLRVHLPQRHGDLINRYTMEQAAMNDSLAYGIELGPMGTFTLRVVQPWKHNGKLIGYIELGEEIEHLTAHMKEISSLDLIFTIDKYRLDREKWEAGLKMLGKKENWDDFDSFVIIDKTIEGVTPALQQFLIRSQRAIYGPNTTLQIAGRTFRLATLPLLDAGQNTVGKLIALYDITEKITALEKLLFSVMMIMLVAGGAVFVFFYIYSGRIESKLSDYHHHLEKLVARRTKKLQQALKEVKTLSGLIPICSFCKKIRDDQGYWNKLESYISKHSDAKFSHSICEDCLKKHYPEFQDDEDDR